MSLGNGIGYTTKLGTGGTVTSVGLTMPGIFSVAGSPITSSGIIGVSFNTQLANRVFAGPASGAAAAPAFRSLVPADITGAAWSITGNAGISGVNFLGCTVANENLFLRAQNMPCAAFFGPRAWICGTGHTTPAPSSIILGGTNSTQVGTTHGVFHLGGNGNSINSTAQYAGIVGGQGNIADANYSYILGSYMRTNAREGVTMIGDHVNDPVFAGISNQFAARFLNGYRFMITSLNRAAEILPSGTFIHQNSYAADTGTPAVTALAGAGTGPTIVVTGNNQVGIITLTAGTAPAAGDILRLTLAGGFAYPNGSVCVFYPIDEDAVTACASMRAPATATTVTMVGDPVDPLTAGTVYQIGYQWKGY